MQREPRRIGRRVLGRRVLFGAAGVAGLGVTQWLSLRGDFDHRSCRPERDAASPWQPPVLPAGAADIVHVGHSTHLVRVAGLRVLTDPWFFDPAHGGMWHEHGPWVAPEHMGELDLVLITHEHPDHADPQALDRLDKRALVVVATAALAARVRGLGFAAVERLSPWQSLSHRGLEISAVPALHDIYEVGYVLRADAQRIYFAGDSALHRDLPSIAERFAPTTAILPVDGTRLRGEPRLVMNPTDAVQAVQVLKPRLVVTSHADARFFDPVLSAYATQEVDAQARFARLLKAAAPHVRCAPWTAGARTQLPAADV